MMEIQSLNYYIFCVFLYIRAVYTVVPEYCTQPFNRGDCGMKPTPVFKYWKPGSRCEIDYWRGCPTANKFPDVYNCTLTCIFKMSNFIEDIQKECETPLNSIPCTEKQKNKIVFTYENRACVERKWEGCPSLNRFDTKAECITACANDNWTAQLQNLNVEQLKEMDNILNYISQAPANETIESNNEIFEPNNEEESEKSSGTSNGSENSGKNENSSGSGNNSGSVKSSESGKNAENSNAKSSSSEINDKTTKKDFISQEIETTTFAIEQIDVLTQ